MFYDYVQRLQTDDQANVRYNEWSTALEYTDDVDVDDNATDDSEYEHETDVPSKCLMIKLIAKYKEEFDLYCRRIVCIGYKSGKYDINLVVLN